MRHDPELVAEVRAWLSKAARDLQAAETLRQADEPLLDNALYHCQQAAEKALKGFLAWHSRPFRKTHNLEEIGEQCLEIDPTLGEVIDRAAPLTEYAWRFRYPGDPQEPGAAEADEALATAREVYEAVRGRLPSEIRP